MDHARDPSLDELFAEARRGDARALARVVERARPALYRVALSFTRDQALADDIAQDALVRALDRHFTFFARGSVLAWMKKIALRLAQDARRGDARRRALLASRAPDAVGMARAPFGDAPDGALAASEARAALYAAIDALPRRQRDVVSLRLLGEHSFDEIGALLGISEANARVTSSQAVQKLRTTLEAGGFRVDAAHQSDGGQS